MANFPIQRSGRTPSPGGSGVEIPMSYARTKARTGEIMGDALMQLGAVGFDEALKWNKLHADTQASDAIKQAGLRINQLADDLDQEKDPTVHPQLEKDAMADIRELRPSSKLAGRMYDFWLNDREPVIDRATAVAMRRREANKVKEDLEQRRENYLGRAKMEATNIILAGGGTRGAFDIIQMPEVIADAGRYGVTADDLTEIVRSASIMADQIKSEEKATINRRMAFSQQRRRGAIVKVLGLIDQGDETVMDTITGTPELSTPVAAKDVSQLIKWNQNRFAAEPDTNYAVAMGLLGEALAVADKPDQYDFRIKLAEARYGEKGKLNQNSYESIKGLLDKGYKAHETGALKAAFKAVNSQTKWYGGQGWFGGGFVPMPPEDRAEQMGKLLSWFDAEREKGVVPTEMQAYTEAKKLGVQGRTESIMAQTQGNEEADKQAVLEGLSDTDRDIALQLLRTMTVEEFRARYMR